jgi:hypothetical protein
MTSIGFGQNLLTNGDFENGATAWGGNAFNAVDDGSGTNKRNVANITTAGNPWDVSLNQPVTLETGTTYVLSYTAYTDATTGTRTMTAGIGQNATPWVALTSNPALTSTPTTFTYTYTVTYESPEVSRVLFDMGSETGYVFIDDVSLEVFVDNTPPSAFTATVGTVGAYSVKLLLTATDDSGTVTYDVSYGTETAQTTGASGVETPFTISGLTSETAYSFAVSASDASGNTATNNPITVPASTVADTSTACAGFTSEASEGSYSEGINYAFTSNGTDVLVSFELLDTDKTGFSPQIHFPPSTFINMDASNAPTYTATLSDSYTVGQSLSFYFRGAYAGGLVTSKLFEYTVGDDCSTASVDDFFAKAVKLHPNPANGIVKFSTVTNEALEVSVYDLLGKQVIPAQTIQSELNIASLNPGMYFVNMKQGASVATKKLLVN